MAEAPLLEAIAAPAVQMSPQFNPQAIDGDDDDGDGDGDGDDDGGSRM